MFKGMIGIEFLHLHPDCLPRRSIHFHPSQPKNPKVQKSDILQTPTTSPSSTQELTQSSILFSLIPNSIDSYTRLTLLLLHLLLLNVNNASLAVGSVGPVGAVVGEFLLGKIFWHGGCCFGVLFGWPNGLPWLGGFLGGRHLDLGGGGLVCGSVFLVLVLVLVLELGVLLLRFVGWSGSFYRRVSCRGCKKKLHGRVETCPTIRCGHPFLYKFCVPGK